MVVRRGRRVGRMQILDAEIRVVEISDSKRMYWKTDGKGGGEMWRSAVDNDKAVSPAERQ